MQIRKNRLMVLVVTIVMLIALFTNAVLAEPKIDTEQKTSLTICYNVEKNPVSGIKFQLYRVADLSSAGSFTVTDAFAGYALSFTGLTSDGWTDLARTLEGYVIRDQLNPAMEGETDENGTIFFPDCAIGLYLLVGDQHTSGQYTYTPQSLLVSLPSMNKDGSLEYDVISEPKFSSDYDAPNPPDAPNDPPGSDNPGEKLPQTGMLKWPIPVMYTLGAGAFFTGYCYRKKATGTSDEDEQKA